jgi:CheY-like chemotaxis protein
VQVLGELQRIPDTSPVTNKVVKILVVEDDPNDVELTFDVPKASNLLNTIHVVWDGARALVFPFDQGAHSVRKGGKGPKVVLLDLKQPKMDGRRFSGAMKADPRTRVIPIVILASSRQERTS